MATVYFLFSSSKGPNFVSCASKTKVKELFSSCIINTFSYQDSECLNSYTTSSCLLKSPENVFCRFLFWGTWSFSKTIFWRVKIYLHISFLPAILVQSGRGSVGKRWCHIQSADYQSGFRIIWIRMSLRYITFIGHINQIWSNHTHVILTEPIGWLFFSYYISNCYFL